jgi:rRNA maturation protein Nop10
MGVELDVYPLSNCTKCGGTGKPPPPAKTGELIDG